MEKVTESKFDKKAYEKAQKERAEKEFKRGYGFRKAPSVRLPCSEWEADMIKSDNHWNPVCPQEKALITGAPSKFRHARTQSSTYPAPKNGHRIGTRKSK